MNKQKRKPTPFATNLKNYIWSNGLSRADFAEKLNKALEEKGIVGKVYSGNDIWTYDSRGSFPKDYRVVQAIANILNVSIEELIAEEFTMEEFAEGKENEVNCEEWKGKLLADLPVDEQKFFANILLESDKEGWYETDIVVKCYPWEKVTAEFWYDEESQKKEVEWAWEEFDKLQRKGDVEYSVIYKIYKTFFEKFEQMNLVMWDGYADLNYDRFRLDDEKYDGCYMCITMRLNINIGPEQEQEKRKKNLKQIIKLYEVDIEKLQKELQQTTEQEE